MADVNVEPKLVKLTTPIIIPTTPQAITVDNDWRVPSSRADY